MQLEETRLHLNRIVDNIATINAQLRGMSVQEFIQNEPEKEIVYKYLQEIGQAARELSNNQKMPPEINIEPLVRLKNAAFNQVAELGHEQVYNMLPELRMIGEQIEQSELYQNSTRR